MARKRHGHAIEQRRVDGVEVARAVKFDLCTDSDNARVRRSFLCEGSSPGAPKARCWMSMHMVERNTVPANCVLPPPATTGKHACRQLRRTSYASPTVTKGAKHTGSAAMTWAAWAVRSAAAAGTSSSRMGLCFVDRESRARRRRSRGVASMAWSVTPPPRSFLYRRAATTARRGPKRLKIEQAPTHDLV